MKIKDSETKFDGWSKLHVFAVFQINGNPNWSRVFGKTTMQVRETTQLGTTQLVEVIIILHCTLPLQPMPLVQLLETEKQQLHGFTQNNLAYFPYLMMVLISSHELMVLKLIQLALLAHFNPCLLNLSD